MFLHDTIELDDEGHQRQLIASIEVPYADVHNNEDQASWEKYESMIEEAEKAWEEDEEIRTRLEARRELAVLLNVVRRGLWIADQADGTAPEEVAAEELSSIRDALREAEIWLEEHWDVETNTAEEFMMEKELLRSVVLPVLYDEDTQLFVHELPPAVGEGDRAEVRSHDEL